MGEQQKDPHLRRLGTPRWIMYWVATIDAHLGEGRATVRSRAIVAGHHPHRLGHPDHVPSPRGARRTERPDPGYHVQYATRWFLTEAEYEAWKDTLPVVEQIDADMLAHIGHMPWEDVPNACVACQVRQKMMETLQ